MTASINASTSSGVVVTSDTSGNLAIQSNGTTVLTATSTGLVAGASIITSGTAVATTSGTAIAISTTIPSWVKKITVMIQGLSTSGTSNYLIQIGSGSYTTSGYASASEYASTAIGITTGFGWQNQQGASQTNQGHIVITNLSGNTWVASGVIANTASALLFQMAGSITLSGVLDRLQITTVNGTDTFDAGSINIQYE